MAERMSAVLVLHRIQVLLAPVVLALVEVSAWEKWQEEAREVEGVILLGVLVVGVGDPLLVAELELVEGRRQV